MNNPAIEINDASSITTAWAVWSTDDEYGRRSDLVGVYLNKDDAIKINSKCGWYGGEGQMAQVSVIVNGIHDPYIIEKGYYIPGLNTKINDLVKARREQALAKLTDDDIQILGLKK